MDVIDVNGSLKAETKMEIEEKDEKSIRGRRWKTFEQDKNIGRWADHRRSVNFPELSVYIKYVGTLQNGKIVESNVGEKPCKFKLGIGKVIRGWDVGICGMRVGDKRRLTIPPSMCYGDKALGEVPKNSTIIYEVELVKVR